MTSCLNDLSHIPLNNKQNEPTQGDIGKTSNDPTQAKRNEFEELYASANEELYLDCDYLTRLDFMRVLFMLTLLIHGPKSPGKDIDVYLSLLIDDLKDLWAKPGDETIDVATGQSKTRLEKPRHSKWLVARPKQNEKCFKPQAAYSFTPEDRKKFCQFIKGDKLPDGFGSNFKHKVTDNDTDITGLKSHDCHIKMQRLLPYGLQQHLPPDYDSLGYPFTSRGYFLRAYSPSIRQRHVDNDHGINKSSELFALACGPSQTPISVNSCVVNGVRFVVHSRDERRTTQNSDGQSIDVDVPPYIIDVVDEDVDIINEEDPIPHDLTNSNDKDLINLDINDGVNMSADVARGHDGDGDGDDRPPPYHVPTGCKGPRKPNLGGKKAGRLHTRQETRNLGLKAITDKNGSIPIRFEVDERETLMPLGDHAAHWVNYLGSSLGSCPCTTLLGAKCRRNKWRGSWQRLGPSLTCVPTWNSTTGHKSMWVSSITCKRSTMARSLHFGMISKTLPGLPKINKTEQRARSYADMDLGLLPPSEIFIEYPSLIHTFFLTHTVGGVFLNPEDKALYDDMLRLQGLSSNPLRAQKSEKRLTKQVNMFMRLFRSDDKFSQMLSQLESQPEYDGGSGSGGCEDDEPRDDEDGGKDEEDEDDS
nr:hypothetical protein [Tanacetum cinerariifolium]